MKPVDPEDREPHSSPAGTGPVQEPAPDQELGRLLQEWSVPAVPDTLDQRVMASFAARTRRRPLWRRLVTTSIRVPLPVALAALLLVAFALWSPRRETPRLDAAPTGSTATPSPEDPPPETRTSLAGFRPVREMNVRLLPQRTP
jgi:hypothetical protein